MASRRGPILEAGSWLPRKQRSLSTHRNPGLEVVCVEAGRAVWHVEDRVEDVPAGSVFFTLPWQRHGSVSRQEPGLSLSFVIFALDRPYERPAASIGFDPRLGLSRADTRWIERVLRTSDCHTHAASPALAWLVPRVVAEMSQRDRRGSSSMLASLGKAVLIELARCVEAGPVRWHPNEAQRRVADFLAALPQRCEQAWTLRNMARACGLGRSRFAELVREQTGDPPIMALNRIRVQRAEHMIRSTAMPITEIALACGFTSSQYFARVFREYTGTTASALR